MSRLSSSATRADATGRLSLSRSVE
jgi:hypothetical protein